MSPIEKYAQAAASTARTPPNSPARRAAMEAENVARIAAEQFVKGLEAERDALRDKLNIVHSWIVCAAIASPEDMMQSAEAIEEVTRPEEA